MKEYYVYILTNKRNGTLYVGVTSNLVKRIYQHKHGITGGFTKKYGLTQLVYYEIFYDVHEALKREKNIKAWRRAWKCKTITQFNPPWKDLYREITQ